MRKTLSVIFYVLVGFPLVLSLLVLLSVRPWALNRDFYKATLTDDRLYEIILSPDLAKEMDEKVVVDGVTLSGPALMAALQKAAPRQELKDLTVQGIDGAFDYLEGRTRGQRASLNLERLKAQLLANKAPMAAAYVEALPSLAGLPAKGDLSYRPLGLPASLVTLRVSDEIGAYLTRAVPDRIAWPPEDLASPAAEGGPTILLPARMASSLAALALGVAFLIALLAVVAGPTARERLAFSGAYIMAPSLLLLGLGAVVAGATTLITQGLTAQGLASLHLGGFLSGSQNQERIVTYAASAISRASGSFFTVGLSGTFLGGLLIAMRKFLTQPERG